MGDKYRSSCKQLDWYTGELWGISSSSCKQLDWYTGELWGISSSSCKQLDWYTGEIWGISIVPVVNSWIGTLGSYGG